MGAQAVLALGLYPFIAGDALKVLVAAGLLPAIWRVLHIPGWRNDRAR